MRAIDQVTEGCIERLVGELGWEKLEESLRRLPSYTRLGVPAGAKCSCSTNAVLSLYLSGQPYHRDTLHSLPQTQPHSLVSHINIESVQVGVHGNLSMAYLVQVM
jgi:hypothetical protein